MLKIKLGILLVFITLGNLFAQNKIIDSLSLINYLKSKDSFVEKIISDSSFRVQISYTKQDILHPPLISYLTINATNDNYFFPASSIKLPIALLALEKMNRLGIELDDILKINSENNCGNTKYIDISQKNDVTFRAMLTEMIVVSDNDYYNSLYHFVTPKEINERLKELGYKNVHIYKAFTGCEMEEQLHTNSLNVYRAYNERIYAQKESFYPLDSMLINYNYSTDNLLGSKHENKDGKIVPGPFDFNYNLEIPLTELNEMLHRLVHYHSIDTSKKWKVSDQQRSFILNTLQSIPSSINKSKYKNVNRYPDNIYRYTVWENQPKNISTISKIGLSYGFTTEVACIYDQKNNVDFILSVSIYTNENDIVNDGDYEYETIARPFIVKVAQLLYQYELGL